MHVAEVQITKRHVRAMCAQSEGVRHLDGERVQARCVVATTALPHSCRVGRALLLPRRHVGWEEGTPSVAHVPSGAVLSQWRVRRPVHVLWPNLFFFFFPYAALYCTTSGWGGKVTSSLVGALPLRVPSRGWTTAVSCQPSPHPALLVRCDYCCPVQWSACSRCFFL